MYSSSLVWNLITKQFTSLAVWSVISNFRVFHNYQLLDLKFIYIIQTLYVYPMDKLSSR